ncbi:MAG: CHAP domain-containing protein [Myxococcales bacterium]|nr:CHAP domain-containing protein [Myxococcales bacterium]MCB9532946.1 CHAP domain-containing protein [Myxococcales bacterium]
MARSRSLILAATLAAAPLAFACGGAVQGASRGAFDQHALNGPWYGAYYRPLPPAGTHESREMVGAAADASTAAREERSRQRAAAAAAASAAPASAQASTQPTPARRGGADPHYDPVDAAAYVRDVYAINDVQIGASGPMTIAELYRFVLENGTIYHNPRPAVGDVVFFNNTVDTNGDSRPNDWFTHVGVVEQVDANGTISVLSYFDDGVQRISMNREHATEATLDGREVNSALRAPRRSDPSGTEHLAGALFAGFGSLLGDRAQVTVLDRWSPANSPSLRAAN